MPPPFDQEPLLDRMAACLQEEETPEGSLEEFLAPVAGTGAEVFNGEGPAGGVTGARQRLGPKTPGLAPLRGHGR